MIKKNEYFKLLNKEGHLNEEGQALYAEHLFSDRLEDLPEEMRLHVSECFECKVSCLELAEILGSGDYGDIKVAENETDEAQEPYHRKKPGLFLFSRQVMRYAALVLLLAGSGIIFILLQRKMKSDVEERLVADNRAVHSRDSLDSLKRVSIVRLWLEKWSGTYPEMAERFVLNPELDALLAVSYRSQEFQVKKPDSIAEFIQGHPVDFQWVTTSEKPLFLKVVDYKGGIVHQRLLSHHISYTFNKKLQPGLYYWFFEQGSLKVAGGRFVVVKDQ